MAVKKGVKRNGLFDVTSNGIFENDESSTLDKSDDLKINEKENINICDVVSIGETNEKLRLNSALALGHTIEEKPLYAYEEWLKCMGFEKIPNIWQEPSKGPEDKFVDIPKEEAIEIKPKDGNLYIDASEAVNFMDQFKPMQVSELPIHINMGGKTYKIKEIEVDDWIKSIKNVITKYQKMNMLLLYLATSTYNTRLVDIGYYIKINNLEELLIEV